MGRRPILGYLPLGDRTAVLRAQPSRRCGARHVTNAVQLEPIVLGQDPYKNPQDATFLNPCNQRPSAR
jgi:hypothetical protein